jgi:predicted negative regulator of RcsB-dependent stress response
MAEDYMTDDEQVEHVKQLTAEYGPWMLGGVLLATALVFGYRYYESYTNGVALKAAAQFSAMTEAFDKNDPNAARKIADGLIKDYPKSPYADQAQLAIARIDVESGDLAKAIAPLTHVMDGSNDADLKQIARLRLARVLIDQGKPDDAIRTLEATPAGAFTALAHQVRGDALYAKKDPSAAAAEYMLALASSDARSPDTALLALKIADLGASQPAAAAAAVAPTSATTPAPAAAKP